MIASKSYWFCYVVDLHTPVRYFPRYHLRENLPFSAPILRHTLFQNGDDLVAICQAGVLIVLQHVHASDEREHSNLYNDPSAFHAFEADAHALTRQYFNVVAQDVLVVFPVVTGAATTRVDWKFVELSNKAVDLHLFLEATVVDHLCRLIEKMSAGLLAEKTLIEQRKLIEYVEGLQEVARPTSFLVNSSELDTMNNFYAEWKLEARVEKIRESFSNSIASSALYNDQLQRNSQSAMNFFLAGIGVLSLAQVSKPITDWLGSRGVAVSEMTFNAAAAMGGGIFVVWGLARYLILPRLGVLLASARDYLAGRLLWRKLPSDH